MIFILLIAFTKQRFQFSNLEISLLLWMNRHQEVIESVRINLLCLRSINGHIYPSSNDAGTTVEMWWWWQKYFLASGWFGEERQIRKGIRKFEANWNNFALSKGEEEEGGKERETKVEGSKFTFQVLTASSKSCLAGAMTSSMQTSETR